MSSCSILIPTYFANSLLHNCLASIFKNIESPKVVVWKNDVGYLQACNKLMSETNDDIILLNDDTIVLTDLVKAMTDVAYNDDKVGIVGGKALDPSGQIIINYGIYLGSDGNTAHKYYGKPKDSVRLENQTAVEGSCMFIKRELIDKIGLFDEGYGLGYREELDFCLRAKEAGYKIVSTPKAEYVHLVSQTNGPLGITNDTHSYFMNKWGKKLSLGLI